MSVLRLYSVAITFAAWSGVRLVGFQSDLIAGAFLALAAVCVVVAERERQRLVRRNRDGYRRRSGD